MNLDFHCHRFDWAGGPAGIGPGVGDLAQRAEAIGVRTLSFMDHWFQMDWMAPAEDPMLEGYTALGFVAGRTDRLRLRLLVTGVTYRSPGLLAKTVTTLDVLSGGRAELGIGAAWYDREHRGLGVPFPPTAERFEWLEEAIQICLQMWSDNNGAYEGKHYRLEETLCSPQAVSTPRQHSPRSVCRHSSPAQWATTRAAGSSRHSARRWTRSPRSNPSAPDGSDDLELGAVDPFGRELVDEAVGDREDGLARFRLGG